LRAGLLLPFNFPIGYNWQHSTCQEADKLAPECQCVGI
jgi:hypothetical protein